MGYERGVLLSDEIDTADYTILSENEATWLPTNGWSTSPDISSASNDVTLLSHWSVSTSPDSDNLPILITINSMWPRLMGLGVSTSTSRKLTGHAMLKPATNTLLKLAKQELSNKSRWLSGKQWIKPVASSFRPATCNTSNQPCRHQPNRSPMSETEISPKKCSTI